MMTPETAAEPQVIIKVDRSPEWFTANQTLIESVKVFEENLVQAEYHIKQAFARYDQIADALDIIKKKKPTFEIVTKENGKDIQSS